jgi:two-component system, chemotaxis family, chemotaxis protein CheY
MSTEQKKTRVLVADDDQAIRQLVCTIVKREGLEAHCAADGAEAIELIRQHDYAVILVDLMMPRVDGFGVIDHLRKHPAEFKPVVLVITAYADQKFKEVDPNIVTGVLRKPFEVADLGNLVRLCVTGFQEAMKVDETFERERRNGWQISEPGLSRSGEHTN